MSLIYDLHSHSIASDGSLTPTELVAHARHRQVDVLALTDHDVTDGLAEAQRAAERQGIRLIAGVEISVTWNGVTVHILGLGIDPACDLLQQGLHKLRDFRSWRAEEIARRLEKHGISGALDGARRHAVGALISRTHFAHYLVDNDYAKDLQDVFKRFLVRNRPGYVPGQWATLEEAVQWINSAGGQAVVAHPARYRLSATKLRILLDEFKSCGGAGLEVVSSSHSQSECNTMARYASRFELLASRGSDYHGPKHARAELGNIPPLPDECQPIWSTWQ
ncbi:MAG: PHP domain-containing protein [Gammaproteobacteria bacterium]|jgi:predicted metal-dependent phosphoesterase TrpH